MLDIAFIRKNLELCKTAAKNKNRDVEWEKLLLLDEKRRELIGKAEALRAERNVLSKQAAAERNQRGKDIKEELKKIEEELQSTQEQFNQLMLTVPNVPDPSVPIGKDERDNVEVKRWATPTTFDFAPRDHIEL